MVVKKIKGSGKYIVAFLVGILFFIILLVNGCSKGNEGETQAEAETSHAETPKRAENTSTGKIKYDVSLATATIKGVVKFEGTAPAPKALKVTEKYCIENYYKDKPLLSESVVVNSNNTLKNVAVYVKDGADKFEFDVPKEPKTLDQKGCKYIPHVLTLQVNQPLNTLNSDPFLHNIHTTGELNPEINFGQPKEGMKSTKTFEYPEVVAFKCDVHSWMSAYVIVLPHPFSSVTDDKGEFQIKLPPGEYTIEAWHEKYGTQSQKIVVGANETKEIVFTYKSQ